MSKFLVSIDGGHTYVETDHVEVRVLDVHVGEVECQLSYLFDEEGLVLDLWKGDEEIIGTEPEDENYDEIAQRLFEVGP